MSIDGCSTIQRNYSSLPRILGVVVKGTSVKKNIVYNSV